MIGLRDNTQSIDCKDKMDTASLIALTTLFFSSVLYVFALFLIVVTGEPDRALQPRRHSILLL